ncbi:zinc-finger-containing protein [[Clostridium] symbiosum]|uniref:zinc-finger-containing protein n=1 Tax=Clostridium symbiosum TaxID=1512 RepID=UPI00321AD13C
MVVDTRPKICNICGEKVEYISNAEIYGRQYGSGFCYRCTACGAYVGTHKPWPDKAMGILANAEMREWKIRCHDLFDSFWRQSGKGMQKRRQKLYRRLAEEMGIAVTECHFGYFKLEQLKQAYTILERWGNRYE